MKRDKPEILAPAGSYDAFLAAVHHGCDAVYLGGEKYGARAYAKNFDIDTIDKSLRYAHQRGVKVYYTINTLFKQKELKGLLEHVSELIDLGMDAFIVQDLGVLSLLSSTFEGIELHASTQMNCHNLEGIEYLKRHGISRVVPARELSLTEIAYITQRSDVEIEAFVHGALCYCYSGQCLMSSFLGGRSGNRGRCAQPCRLKYEVSKAGQYNLQSHLLSPKDIETLTILPELIEAGISSFKIEGRMKNPEYVGLMTKLYRYYRDYYYDHTTYEVREDDLRDMIQIFNRGEFSQGYYKQHSGKNMMTKTQPKHQGALIGKVASQDQSMITIDLLDRVQAGDSLEVMTTKGEAYSFVINEKSSNKIKTYVKGHVKIGSEVRRIKSMDLVERLHNSELVNPLVNLNLNVRLRIDEPSSLVISDGIRSIEVKGELVQAARSQGLTEEKIIKQLSKTDQYPLKIKNISVDQEGECFMPVSHLNAIRRQALELWFEESNITIVKRLEPIKKVVNHKTHKKNITVLLKKHHQFETIKGYDVQRVYLEWMNFDQNQLLSVIRECSQSNRRVEVYLAVPKIIRQEKQEIIKDLFSQIPDTIDGFLIRSLEGYELVKGLRKAIAWDYSMNCMNNETYKHLLQEDVNSIMPSLELNKGELRGIEHRHTEILAYGYPRTMTSAQCIRKNTSGCVIDQGHIFSLKDRKDIESQVETHCSLCYNAIYNGMPLYLIDQIDYFQSIGIGNFRVDFLNEPVQVITQIMDTLFTDKIIKPDQVLSAFTRGHYNKGVE